MNNNILAIAFLMAGTLLTTAVITMVPYAYAEDNKNKADDESIAQLNDCDDNEFTGDTPSFTDVCANTVE
jgi:hypothetical protein